MCVRAIALCVVLIAAGSPTAAQAGPDDLHVRVVDVGPGLCTVTKVPGEDRFHYMVYDAGHWVGGRCIEAVRDVVGDDEEIDLLILSHSDSDHLGDVPEILEEFTVRQIIQAGLPNPHANTWKNANDAIGEEAKTGATVINLQTVELVPGSTIHLGEATLTLVAGWGHWDEPGPTPSEKRNAISVVVRLDFQGKSILFGGDTVGRRLGDADTACKDAEKVMSDRHDASEVSLKSDVLIAPHHGGNNGSAGCFIARVDPTFVVFSAGHDHGHPSNGAATRYLHHGVVQTNMFRTDRGDDEPGSFEWKAGSIAGCTDARGDDDVEIVITDTGTLSVAYRQAQNGC